MFMWGHIVGINDDNYITCRICDMPLSKEMFEAGSKTCHDCIGDIKETSSKWGCNKCRKVYTFKSPIVKPDKCINCDGNDFRRVYLT